MGIEYTPLGMNHLWRPFVSNPWVSFVLVLSHISTSHNTVSMCNR